MPVAAGNTDTRDTVRRHRGDGTETGRRRSYAIPVPLTRRRPAARRDWNRIRRALPYRRNETDLNEGAPCSIGGTV